MTWYCEDNCEQGYQEFKHNFDMFFEDKDPADMSNEALDDFMVEFERAVEMLHKGHPDIFST